MGMFDDIFVRSPLMPTEYQDVDWQTKSLDRNLDLYIITEDNNLMVRNRFDKPDVNYIKVDFTGDVHIHGYKNFYKDSLDVSFETMVDHAIKSFYTGILRFENGILVEVRDLGVLKYEDK